MSLSLLVLGSLTAGVDGHVRVFGSEYYVYEQYGW